MDLRWAEDFVCLARLRNFSRAAEARHVTQSAFSRRIRSLENWFGMPLVDRSMHPAALTAAGEIFLETAAEIVRRMHEARENASQAREKIERTVTFSAQHSLSLDFFARWMEAAEKRVGNLDVRMTADNYYTAVHSLREGASDFLLCFTHPKVASSSHNLFESCVLGREHLIPVSPAASGRARFRLPGSAAKPTPYLSYGAHTFFGKVVRLILDRHPCCLELRYENAFSESLKSMALCGRGAVWLPESAARKDIAEGRLRRIGGARWREPMDIRLFRRPEKTTPLSEMLWKEFSREAAAHSNNA